ncbi:MAG: isoamylase early set domain-containing protein [Pyrinomonadaceae bacterium]|nr:isoamylase early set domain-containing protein [Sphingobacteriaceae bacterium]
MLQKTFVKSKNAYKVKFTLRTAHVSTVDILGLNSDWETPIPLNKKKDGSFSAEIVLPKDTKHQFKYLLDQTDWLIDEDADGESPNEFGSTNSVLVL